MIALGSDHAGFPLKEHIKRYLENKGIPVSDLGCGGTDAVHYPDYGEKVALAVAGGRAERGVAVCGTGVGIAIAANKVPGVRAAVCVNGYMARMARLHNDANVLALGARVIGAGVAEEIVDLFLETPFEGGRHRTRVDMFARIEKDNHR